MVGDASPLTSPAPPAPPAPPPPIAVTLEGVKSCLLRALQEQREDRLLEALLHCDRSLKANPSHKRVGKEEEGEDLCDTPSVRRASEEPRQLTGQSNMREKWAFQWGLKSGRNQGRY